MDNTMPRAELATLGSYGRALRFAHALATTALLAGCFADEGFGLDSTPDTDGDDETAATAPTMLRLM